MILKKSKVYENVIRFLEDYENSEKIELICNRFRTIIELNKQPRKKEVQDKINFKIKEYCKNYKNFDSIQLLAETILTVFDSLEIPEHKMNKGKKKDDYLAAWKIILDKRAILDKYDLELDMISQRFEMDCPAAQFYIDEENKYRFIDLEDMIIPFFEDCNIDGKQQDLKENKEPITLYTFLMLNKEVFDGLEMDIDEIYMKVGA